MSVWWVNQQRQSSRRPSIRTVFLYVPNVVHNWVIRCGSMRILGVNLGTTVAYYNVRNVNRDVSRGPDMAYSIIIRGSVLHLPKSFDLFQRSANQRVVPDKWKLWYIYILLSSQLKCVLQRCWTSYCWLHDRTSQCGEWCESTYDRMDKVVT